jgi:hypothetical protein
MGWVQAFYPTGDKRLGGEIRPLSTAPTPRHDSQSS